jgi:spermidine synthase
MALAWQVLLMREFAAHFSGNELIFGILLGAWLLFSGTGSLLGSKIRFTAQRFFQLYYFTILILPLCLLALRFSRFPLRLLPGETTGMLPALLFSLILCLFLCFPLGVLFVFNTRDQGGRPARVYMIEALGSAFSGILLYFLMIPGFSNWQSAAVLGGVLVILVYWNLPGTRFRPIPFLVIALIVFGLMDMPTQRRFWKPYSLTDSTDSRYGKLQLIRTQEQYSLYNNGVRAYTYPDRQGSEEAVHFALLQKPEASRILLIGGGGGGSLSEILKYPHTQVDYLELDPGILRFAEKGLTQPERQVLRNDRVRIMYRDGRAFLQSSPKHYDIIILNLPDPSTAQINRFFTQEFFRLAQQRLNPEGLFSLRVTSSENYISRELQEYLSSLYTTLATVFTDIEVIPGGNNIFLASRRLPRLSTEALVDLIHEYKLDNLYVSPEMLPARLSPLRIKTLTHALLAHPGVINRDLKPVSYYFHTLIWATQFQLLESRLVKLFAALGPRWLLDVPLVVFCLALLAMGVKGKKPIFIQTPLLLLGLTTITAEILTILAFQNLKGYLYHSLALLFAVFMLGLAVGAMTGLKTRRRIGFNQLIWAQAFMVALLASQWILQYRSVFSGVFYLFLFLLGLLGGFLFVAANQLYLQIKTDYGRGYGLDLLGGFIGALITSSILVPLLGIPAVLGHLILANTACLGFLFWGKFQHRD